MASSCESDGNHGTTTSMENQYEEANYCLVEYADAAKAKEVVAVGRMFRGKRKAKRQKCTSDFIKKYYYLNRNIENVALRVAKCNANSNMMEYHKIRILAFAATEAKLKEKSDAAVELGREKRVVKNKHYFDSPLVEESPMVTAVKRRGKNVQAIRATEEEIFMRKIKHDRKTKKENLAEIMLEVESVEEIKPTLRPVKGQPLTKIGETAGTSEKTPLDGMDLSETHCSGNIDEDGAMTMSTTKEWRDEPGFGPESTLKRNTENDSMISPTDSKKIQDAEDRCEIKKKLLRYNDESNDDEDSSCGNYVESGISKVDFEKRQVFLYESAGRKKLPTVKKITWPTEEEKAHCNNIIAAAATKRGNQVKKVPWDENNARRLEDSDDQGRLTAAPKKGYYDFNTDNADSTNIHSAIDNTCAKKRNNIDEKKNTGRNISILTKRAPIEIDNKENEYDSEDEPYYTRLQQMRQENGKQVTSGKKSGDPAGKDKAQSSSSGSLGRSILDGDNAERDVRGVMRSTPESSTISVTGKRCSQQTEQAKQRRAETAIDSKRCDPQAEQARQGRREGKIDLESKSRQQLIELLETTKAELKHKERLNSQLLDLIREIRNSGPDWKEIYRKVRQFEDGMPNDEEPGVLDDLPEETQQGTIIVGEMEWNYNYFREASNMHRDTARVVALAKALWPNERERKKLVLRKRRGTPENLIQIDLRDIEAIKSSAEKLDGIRNLDMRKKWNLARYRQTIGNMIKCSRNRSKRSEGNASGERREDSNDNEEEEQGEATEGQEYESV